MKRKGDETQRVTGQCPLVHTTHRNHETHPQRQRETRASLGNSNRTNHRAQRALHRGSFPELSPNGGGGVGKETIRGINAGWASRSGGWEHPEGGYDPRAQRPLNSPCSKDPGLPRPGGPRPQRPHVGGTESSRHAPTCLGKPLTLPGAGSWDRVQGGLGLPPLLNGGSSVLGTPPGAQGGRGQVPPAPSIPWAY